MQPKNARQPNKLIHTMTRTILPFTLFLLFACTGPHTEQEGTSSAKQEEHGTHHKHGSANEHMHQSSVEDLIKRFESSERDAYQKPELVLDYLGDITGKKVIDIGAGSGYFSVKLADRGAQVIAADVNDEFQAYIKKRILENNLSNIETRKIPYDAPGLDNQEVEMALMVNTYHHIENRPDYFAKVKTGLTDNGELVIIDFFDFETPVGPKHHKISIDTVIDELKKAGFTTFDVEVNQLPYQYMIKAR